METYQEGEHVTGKPFVKQKSSSDKSDELLICCIFEGWDLTYLSRF